jgi:lipid-A-disaccharide synthase
MTDKTLKIMLIAGESSGDAHAAHLVSTLRPLFKDRELQFFGATGPKMRVQGVETVVSADDFAVVGVAEVLLVLPRFLKAKRLLIESAKERRPDVVILIDFPEFNMKIAKSLKSLGIPVIYFISPQLWAWRRYRVRGIKRDVDMLLSIFPFERRWYEDNGYSNCFYVGNPTAELLSKPSPLCGERSHIALLPGSRSSEISKILPVMLRASEIVSREFPGKKFLIPAASEIAETEIVEVLEKFLRESGADRNRYSVERGNFAGVVGGAEVAAVASGTATLETALMGTPLVVVYRSSLLNFILLRPLISVPFFSLVNLIGGGEIAKELIQFDFTPNKLAAELIKLMDPNRNREFREELESLRTKLHRADDGKSAADRVAEFLEKSTQRG